jgi:hypothetical protein
MDSKKVSNALYKALNVGRHFERGTCTWEEREKAMAELIKELEAA